MTNHVLVRNAVPLWHEATHAPFLDALAAGCLASDAFRRWLAQDYLFAKDLLTFQAILLAKSPRDCHAPLIGGLAALDKEMGWFESHAARLQVDLDVRTIVFVESRNILQKRFKWRLFRNIQNLPTQPNGYTIKIMT